MLMYLSISFCVGFMCICVFACVCKDICMCLCMDACSGLRLTWGAFLDHSLPYNVSQLNLEVINTASLASQDLFQRSLVSSF